MSERMSFSAGIIALAVAVLPLPAQGQSAAELRVRRDSLEQRFAVARAELDHAQNLARAVPNDSLLLQGSIVRFNTANLDERERRSLARAFDVAAAELEDLFGAGGKSLVEGQVWHVTVVRSSTRRGAVGLGLEPVDDSRRLTTGSLRMPLSIPAVTEIIRDQAGRNLIRSQQRVRNTLGGGFSIDEPIGTHYLAHRHLALHQSSPARRCARGNISACADIFNDAARARWFDDNDSANRDRAPAAGVVRESLLRYAIEVDGPAVLRAFQAPADSTQEPLPFIAAAVGQVPEQLLRGWQARVAESGAVSVRASPRTILAAVGWFALCGLVATRRRPQ